MREAKSSLAASSGYPSEGSGSPSSRQHVPDPHESCGSHDSRKQLPAAFMDGAKEAGRQVAAENERLIRCSHRVSQGRYSRYVLHLRLAGEGAAASG
ncbi:MAG: hypothetical protein DUD39_09470 [Coriobacteriaceae bacterium]|nr:MAG: hypothetical protein DUD39_09470 [Coriobacteriaceae bacterium]